MGRYQVIAEDIRLMEEKLQSLKGSIPEEKYEELSDEQRENYDAAYKALNQDEKVVYSDNMLICCPSFPSLINQRNLSNSSTACDQSHILM